MDALGGRQLLLQPIAISDVQLLSFFEIAEQFDRPGRVLARLLQLNDDLTLARQVPLTERHMPLS